MPPPSVPLALVGIVVFAVGGIFGDPLFECLQDADYGELLDIVEKGLPVAKSPRHVAIIGGGIAGLTAAKFLEDAGHKVTRSRFFFFPLTVTFPVGGLMPDAGVRPFADQVTVVEASGRIGGRVETYRDRREGWYVEVGAMRIPSFHK